MKNKIINFLVCALLLSIHQIESYSQTIMNIHQNNGTIIQIPINTIDSITYTINNPGNLATLITFPVENITNNSCISGGDITLNGGSSITQRGVCWNTLPNPIISNYVEYNGAGTGSFTININGLSSNTTYYIRAFAINSAGVSYGNEISFSTNNYNASVSELDCINASITGSLIADSISNGVNVSLPYNGGNGGSYSNQNIISSGVNGLTANLDPGVISNNSGNLNLTIEGIPDTSGIAYFTINFGGQSCILSIDVENSFGISVNQGLGVIFDGYAYNSIILGNGQEWINENLKTHIFSNGDSIPHLYNGIELNNITTPAWVFCNNDIVNDSIFGKLYNWYTVSDSRNVCPNGWHVPSDAEWTLLTDYLGGEIVAGGKMKIEGTQYWSSPNVDATNESGFNALPGAYCNANNGAYYNFGGGGLWWSSSENDAQYAWFRLIYSYGGFISRNGDDKENGLSVRCLKN